MAMLTFAYYVILLWTLFDRFRRIPKRSRPSWPSLRVSASEVECVLCPNNLRHPRHTPCLPDWTV